MNTSRSLLLGLTLLTAGVLVGCSGATKDTDVVLVDKESNGYKTFQNSCAGCHGQNLEGRAGPNLQHIGMKLDADKLTKQIQNGGPGMPAFANKLDQTQISELAAWLAKQQ
ncbi:cytochrome c [Tumebacillus sp. ITR2]|uniref:Cytochrome c n=1 Tax=Tumebacillus amylolyticus TaxID=2801339 RepID=A0ABS1J671_9BACL|nr:cytochrome c [Tumebacillus amylolyticus]MBL0385695.1 cytochrome c [Tumebacillus amylolyticus]